MKKLKIPRCLKKKQNTIGILILVLIIIVNFINFTSTINLFFNETTDNINPNPKMSGWLWATLDLTNPLEVNNSRFTHYDMISVKGHLYNKIDKTNKSGINVAIEIDDVVDMGYTDVTDSWGRFDISYTIDPFLDVYSAHKIEVVVTDLEPGGPGSEIEYHHFYIIYVNATSYFDILSHDDTSIPKLTEEDFNLNGYLNYDNGDGIVFESVNYFWFSGPSIISQGSDLTGASGALPILQVPITTASQLTLKFNYSDPPNIEFSEYSIPNIKVFSDVAWNLDIDYTTRERALYTLTGILSSSTNPSLKINNREVEVYFNGTQIDTATTRADGSFTSTFRIPDRNGTASIQVQLVNSAGKDISSTPQLIFVESAPSSPFGGGGLPPFLIFSLIFFPILAGIVAGLAVYGYKYYKKQEKESRVVSIPLESKFRNLKILKDSGRLEESISYLYNAIYMDLIDAKYNRKRKENETIRDFAIISVKELKLTPSSIYPFIQKVEEIIYAKPFKITDKDFYSTCDLFSPIYFQLTGYNFNLNF
ncbi:MAG: hypothetical protein ACFE9S_12215 [Candidatus Hermodarchaeota archaeon]